MAELPAKGGSALKIKNIYTVRARLVPAATIKFFEVLVRVLNESGFYLSAGCIFFIFCLLAISKIKNAVLRRKK